jgi:hypothetical protein
MDFLADALILLTARAPRPAGTGLAHRAKTREKNGNTLFFDGLYQA